MDPLIPGIAALVGAIISAVLQPIIADRLKKKRFESKKKLEHIPSIIGVWDTNWFLENDELLHGGYAELRIGEDYNRIVGTGSSPNRCDVSYSISGEVDSSRFFLMTYRNFQFPTIGYVGTAILKVSVDGRSMTGTWSGHAVDDKEIQIGRMEWTFDR